METGTASLTTLLTGVTELLTWTLTSMTSLATWVLGNPLAFAFVGMVIVGFAAGMLFRVLNSV